MSTIADAFNSWLRDYVSDGVPASGANPPSKAEGRSIGGLIESYIADAIQAGLVLAGPVEIRCDLTTDAGAVSAASGVYHFRLPHAMQLLDVRASLTAASSSGPVQVDVLANGTSVFSTKVQIDQGATTSIGSAVPMAIDVANLKDDWPIVFNITEGGSGAEGLKVTLLGVRTTFGNPETPYFFANGSASVALTPTGASSPSYPAGVLADDIAFLVVAGNYQGATDTATIIAPSGFALVGTQQQFNSGNASPYHNSACGALFWRRCDGSESSTSINVSSDQAQNTFSNLVLFRSCVGNGTPYENAAQTAGSTAAATGSAVVASLGTETVVTFYSAYLQGDAGGAGAGWTTVYNQGVNFSDGGNVLAASTFPAPLAATIAPEARTLTGNAPWFSWTVALLPLEPTS